MGPPALAAWLLGLIAVAMIGAQALAEVTAKGIVTEIRIEGYSSINEDDIRRKIVSKVGREIDERTVEADQKSLLASKWFSDVTIYYDKDPKRKGFILIFQVVEMPVLRSVEFRGRTKLRLKDIEENTGLKKDARADHLKNQLAVNQIRRLYEEKGYELAEVRLLKGGKPGENDVVFEIFEGPKCKIGGISFVGNDFFSDATLQTKITSRTPLLGLLGGKYHRDDVDEDARKLRQYYQDMGFFEVKVTPVLRRGSSLGQMMVEFDIWEGTRYKVRNIEIVGNEKVPTAKLRDGLILHSNKPFIDSLHQVDKKKIEQAYGEIGCIDAQIEVEHKYTDQPGVVDLVYRIEEGDPYVLGHFIIRGNDRTRDKVLRREAEMAGLVPGEPLNVKHMDLYKQRLGNLRYFVASPDMGKPLDVKLVNRRPHDQPYGESPFEGLDRVIRTRLEEVGGPRGNNAGANNANGNNAGANGPGEDRARLQSPSDDEPFTRLQNPGPEAEPGPAPGLDDPPPLDAAPAPRANNGNAAPAPRRGPAQAAPVEPPAAGAGPAEPFGAGGVFDPPPDLPPVELPALPPASEVPATPRGSRTPPITQDESPGGFPNLPGANMTDVGPDRSEPFPNRSYVDIITQVEEAPTGRLMFGVGASSFQGLTGNFVLHESNFDIFAVPRSFRELFSGQAFRGAGQDFRIDLQPGTLVNRAVVSFRDPYLFDLPIGFGASGYAFSRFYPGQFNESRGGGRFSLGRQFGTLTYADVAFRIEDVKLDGFRYPAPAPILAAAGHTTLATLRPSLRFDNRNDPFSPNKGQYVEFAFEQGWGTFTFPKVTVEGRQYFTLGSRPDGTGKRTLTTRAFFGVTGRDTPIYEKFYAGDFRSMRGFSYRGVGPRELGINVGGVMTAIGSIEYQFPWLANDKLQQVVFCDFGTVEPNYNFTTFRAAVGTGLRVYLPQQMFGPLPLAFDLAFPVAKGPEDHTRYFTFFIGAFW